MNGRHRHLTPFHKRLASAALSKHHLHDGRSRSWPYKYSQVRERICARLLSKPIIPTQQHPSGRDIFQWPKPVYPGL